MRPIVLQNPQSAAAQFVLAYHYLTQGHAEAAVKQFKIVSTLQPKDQLSAQLVQQLQKTDQPAAGTELAQGQPAAGAGTGRRRDDRSAGKEENWRVPGRPSLTDTTITVTFQDKGISSGRSRGRERTSSLTGPPATRTAS